LPHAVVVYDACVLYPAPLRDLLIELASTALFMAKWTDRIHDEWIESLLGNRPDLTRERLERTRHLMNAAIPDCLVDDYARLIPAVTDIPDENDRHVVAAAIYAHADAIVTFNLRDFPTESLARFGLEAIHPDDFVMHLLERDRVAFLDAVRNCRARLDNPPVEATRYVATLRSQALPKTADALLPYTQQI
jgi:hypothetical protein